MKVTQINGARGLILKSSIKKVIIDSDVENASAFKDIVITHLSLDTLNIIQSNASKYRRINLSYDLMLLLQKLWRNHIIKKPDVMPKFRILPTGYSTTLGLEFKITAFDSDDGLTGSIAVLIEDLSTGEKLGYVPNFITQGQHKNRIKKWKRIFKEEQLSQFVSFNSNINQNATKVTCTEKNIQDQIEQSINSDHQDLQKWLKPFNPARLLKINELATANNQRMIWLKNYATFLNYYYPDTAFAFVAEKSAELNPEQIDSNLIAIPETDFTADDIVQQKDPYPLADQLEKYQSQFLNSLPKNDFLEIIRLIGAQESYLI